MGKTAERLEWQRNYRKKTANASTKKYEKTKKGKLVRTYRNMLSRTKGILKKKVHLYGGLPILDKEDFYSWSLENKDFHETFEKWVESGYEKRFSPSIDRLDTSEGYVVGNMRWVTHSENSREGGKNA